MTLAQALASLFGLSANIAIQVLACRLFPSRGLLGSIMLGFGAGLVVTLALSAPWPPRLDAGTIGTVLTSVITYAALGFSFFHVNNMGETARRIRLLRELVESPAGLTEAELLSRYGSREVLDRRLTRLLATRQLGERDGRYFADGSTVRSFSLMIGIAKKLVFKNPPAPR